MNAIQRRAGERPRAAGGFRHDPSSRANRFPETFQKQDTGRRLRITRFAIILGMLVFWIVLGTGLEIAQLWIPYRKFDLMDIFWSAAGALAGSLVLVIGYWLLVIGCWF